MRCRDGAVRLRQDDACPHGERAYTRRVCRHDGRRSVRIRPCCRGLGDGRPVVCGGQRVPKPPQPVLQSRHHFRDRLRLREHGRTPRRDRPPHRVGDARFGRRTSARTRHPGALRRREAARRRRLGPRHGALRVRARRTHRRARRARDDASTRSGLAAQGDGKDGHRRRAPSVVAAGGGGPRRAHA